MFERTVTLCSASKLFSLTGTCGATKKERRKKMSRAHYFVNYVKCSSCGSGPTVADLMCRILMGLDVGFAATHKHTRGRARARAGLA